DREPVRRALPAGHLCGRRHRAGADRAAGEGRPDHQGPHPGVCGLHCKHFCSLCHGYFSCDFHFLGCAGTERIRT
ncbi:unnamed protein product, partial [Heterosigma akashiwo]